MDYPKLPTLEKKDNQSLIVLIDNSKDNLSMKDLVSNLQVERVKNLLV